MKINFPHRSSPAPERAVTAAAYSAKGAKSIFDAIAGAVLILTATLCLCNLPVDPAMNPDNVAVLTSLCDGGECADDSLTCFLDDTITLALTFELAHLIDSLSVTIPGESNRPARELYRAGRSPADTIFSLWYDHPCTLQVVTEARLSDKSRRTDTATVFIGENSATNTAPVQTLYPKRTYATPLLPCSIAVKTFNAERWQTLRTALGSMPESAHLIGDSLFVRTPPASDTGTIDTLIFITRDNSNAPLADTDTVLIAVIPDDAPPATPEGFKIIQRRLKNVTFCWNGVLSADYYRIYRNVTPGTNGWVLIDSTADTVYTDETDSSFYYQITAVNVFYRSKPSVFISGNDTLFHGISFPDSAAAFSETDSIVTIAVRLTEPLPETLTVSYAVSAGGTTADSLDFSFVDSVRLLQFAPGDTVKNVRIRMIDDTVPEYGETVMLRLLHPSMTLPERDSVFKCEILPDRDALRQKLRISVVRIVCEMADDEGGDNTVDITALDVAVSVAERTADTTARRETLSNGYIHQYNGGEIAMATSTTLNPWASLPVTIVLDADRFEPSMALFVFSGYAVDYDPLNANDIGTGLLNLGGENITGPRSFTIVSSSNFVIRVELMVEAAE